MNHIVLKQIHKTKLGSLFHLLICLARFFRYLDPTRDLPSLCALQSVSFESEYLVEPEITSPTTTPIRALFLNVDETLLDEKHPDLDQSSFNALRTLQKRGIKIALVTMRNMAAVLSLSKLNEFPFDGYILAGGSEIFDGKRRLIEHTAYIPADLKAIFDECQTRQIPVFFYGKKPNLTIWTKESQAFAAKMHFLPIEIKPWSGEDISMLTIISTDPEQVQSILELTPGLSWISSGSNQQHLYPEGASQRNGIKKMLAYWNLEGSYSAAFGKNKANQNVLAQTAFIAPSPLQGSMANQTDFDWRDHQENSISCVLKTLGLLENDLSKPIGID